MFHTLWFAIKCSKEASETNKEYKELKQSANEH